jgi:hypothetical protein
MRLTEAIATLFLLSTAQAQSAGYICLEDDDSCEYICSENKEFCLTATANSNSLNVKVDTFQGIFIPLTL